jgi:hypothetical protein
MREHQTFGIDSECSNVLVSVQLAFAILLSGLKEKSSFICSTCVLVIA